MRIEKGKAITSYVHNKHYEENTLVLFKGLSTQENMPPESGFWSNLIYFCIFYISRN